MYDVTCRAGEWWIGYKFIEFTKCLVNFFQPKNTVFKSLKGHKKIIAKITLS